MEFYYIFTNERPENISYAAFPHINTGLSFFRNVTITRHNHEIYIERKLNDEDTFQVELLGKYIKPVLVHYRGVFDEVAIIFKPAGLSQFLSVNLSDISPQYSQELKIENWNKFAATLFKEPSTVNRIGLLDTFLNENLKEKHDERILKSLSYLEEAEAALSVAKVAQLAGMNLKTFQRHFQKVIGCSPSNYKRIARFRKSVNSKLVSTEIKSLTKITYENKYYDQSYFIREFKKLTNLNPGNFFNSITVLEKEGIIWEIR